MPCGNFFKLCFKASNDSYHKWFQYRILHCTLATQELLNKMSMSNSPTCLSCQSNIESLCHLFYFCPNSKQLWTQLENKIKISTQFTVNFNPCDVLLGYTLDNNNSIAINVILLVTKAYIYKTSRILKKYYIKDVIQLVERTYNEQHLAAKLDYKEHKFEREWHQMKLLFT